MEFFIDFLVNNYMWFLMITIVLFFALVGYIVDSKEQKTATVFDSPLEMQRNLEYLAASAQNKTMGDIVTTNPVNPQMNYSSSTPMNMNSAYSQTTINPQMQMNYQGNSMNPNYYQNQTMNYMQPQNPNPNMNRNMGSPATNSSFEVLGK